MSKQKELEAIWDDYQEAKRTALATYKKAKAKILEKYKDD